MRALQAIATTGFARFHPRNKQAASRQRLANGCSVPIGISARVAAGTMQLYLDSTVRYLHHAGSRVVALVLSLIAGMTIETCRRATRATGGRATPITG